MVNRPAQYLGHELNITVKDYSSVKVSVVLAFPDIYEVGQSYVGFHILYHRINRRADAVAERVFAPWVDMERLMKARGIPLCSLETLSPLSKFDLIGFTLPWELTYPTVLNMIDLAGLPLSTAQRDEGVPIIVAGGRCALHPEPLADYIDAFVLGDGEGIIDEILDVVIANKQVRGGRLDLLSRLSEIEGVYVPCFYEGIPSAIHIRQVSVLQEDIYPRKPLVPAIPVLRDRLSIEVARPGYPHRIPARQGDRETGRQGEKARKEDNLVLPPLRVRDMNGVVDALVSGITSSGFDDVGFLAPFLDLNPLVGKVAGYLMEKRVTASFPLVSPKHFSGSVANLLRPVGKGELSFPFESDSRQTSKGEALYEAVQLAYDAGWNLVKVYLSFGSLMDDEDFVQQTISSLGTVVTKGTRTGGGKQLNIAISQALPITALSFDKVRERHRQLHRRICEGKGLHIRWRAPEVALIESLLSVGDRRLGTVLRHVWEAGARFEHRTDCFDAGRWENGCRQAGLDVTVLLAEKPLYECAVSPVDEGQGLPLQTLDFRHDRQGQFSSVISPISDRTFGRRLRRTGALSAFPIGTTIRMEYAKRGTAAFFSHLDFARIFIRALRRGDLPIAYSRGYHPRPKIGFGPPLPLGVEGEREYIDVELSASYRGDIVNDLKSGLPEGITLSRVRPFIGRVPALSATINRAVYEVTGDLGSDLDYRLDCIRHLDQIPVERSRQGMMDIRPGIDEIEVMAEGNGFRVVVTVGESSSPRIHEIVRMVIEADDQDRIALLKIVRMALFIEQDGSMITPFEVCIGREQRVLKETRYS